MRSNGIGKAEMRSAKDTNEHEKKQPFFSCPFVLFVDCSLPNLGYVP